VYFELYKITAKN